MRDASLFIAALLAITGCDPAPVDEPDASAREDAATSDTGTIPGEDAGTTPDAFAEPDSGPPDMRREAFLANLDGTVWNGRQTRTEAGGDIERAFEMHF